MKHTFEYRPWMVWSSAIIAIFAVMASITGLFAAFPYALETENWQLQAKGQDIGNLGGAVALVISILLARRGSLRAYQVWLGTLFYFLYAYIIYAFAVHFSSLFLLYVALLGLTLYTVIGALSTGMPIVTVGHPGARRFAGTVLIATGVLFGLLWLSEVIPATLSGEVPKSLSEAGLWVNPVHVIDLSAVLPGFIICGWLVIKNRPVGTFLAAPWLVFSVLMGSSIVAATVLMASAGFANTLPPMVMVSVLVVVSLGAVWRLLRYTAR